MSAESNDNKTKKRPTKNREEVFRIGHDQGYREGIAHSLAIYDRIEAQTRRILMIVGQLPEALIDQENKTQVGDAVSIIIETIDHFRSVIDRKNLRDEPSLDKPLEKSELTS